jgi:hypothetical protein
MSIPNLVNQTIGYFSDAVAVIFSVDREAHSPVGVQPFTGEINRRRKG